MTYHHSIERNGIDAVSIGSVYLDLDKDILTGLQNASGVFPTFGSDALIHYEMYPQSLGGEFYAVLILEDPVMPAEFAKVRIGSYVSDSSFERQGDSVMFSIPLSLLPRMSTDAILIADTMAPIESRFDSYPENGGFRLKDGSIHPFNSCQTKEELTTDPAGDSYAFGKDNDDFLSATACYCDEGLLLTMEYTDWAFGGRSMTTVFMDLDQNSSTGESFNTASSATLGVEKSLVYKLSDVSGGAPVERGEGGSASCYYGGSAGSLAFFTAIMVEGASGDLIRGVNPLFTLNLVSNKVYITIPYRLIDDGNMDLYAWALSGTFGVGSFADGIPNEGKISLNNAPTPGTITPDQADNSGLDSSDSVDSSGGGGGDGGGSGCFIAAVGN